MRKYDILIDGASVSVFYSLCKSDNCTDALASLSDSELGVMIYSDIHTDFGALSFDKYNNKPREPYLTIAALSYFFTFLKGYPRMTLDIVINGILYELPISNDDLFFSVNVGKCKSICANSIKFRDGIVLDGIIIGEDKSVVVFPCSDTELFCKDRLRTLLAGYNCAVAVSVRPGGEVMIKSSKEALSYSLIAECLCAIPSLGYEIPDGRLRVIFNERELNISQGGNSFIFYPDIKYIS